MCIKRWTKLGGGGVGRGPQGFDVPSRRWLNTNNRLNIVKRKQVYSCLPCAMGNILRPPSYRDQIGWNVVQDPVTDCSNTIALRTSSSKLFKRSSD